MEDQKEISGELLAPRGTGWVLYECFEWDRGSIERIEIPRSREIRDIFPEDVILSTGLARKDKYCNLWIQVMTSSGTKGWMLSHSVEKLSEID